MSLLLVVSAMAVPSVVRSWRTYELNSCATLVANMFKSCRSDAIRRNTTMNCILVQQGGAWYVGEDQDNNGVLDANEPQVAIISPNTINPAGAPDSSSMTGYPSVPQPIAPGLVAFNARGGVDFGPGNPPVIYVVYIGETGDPTYGFRAVTIVPSGTTQVWIAPGGTWSKLL